MKFKGITRKSKQARTSGNKKDHKQEEHPKKSPPSKKTIGKKSQFPNIYRIITEKVVGTLKQPRFWISLVTAFFLICLLFIVFLVFRQVEDLRQTLQTRKDEQTVLAKWENVIQKYPGLRDGYVGAGTVAYQLGQYDKARLYIGKALELDPNFEPAEKMGDILKIRGQ